MRFGIYTLDDFDVKGKTVLCRVDMNQPIDRANEYLTYERDRRILREAYEQVVVQGAEKEPSAK